MTQLPIRGSTLLAALLTLLCSAVAAAGQDGSALDASQETAADTPVEAVWKVQRLAFRYQGSGSFYSCRALASKIENILLSLGAREDVRLSRFACDDGFGLARFEIEFSSPVEATPENVQAVTTYSAEQELLARARGQSLPSATDLPRFPAQWRKVSFSRDRRIRLQPSDCELAQAVRDQILARMSVRIIRDSFMCSPSGNAGAPRLTVTALVPIDRID